MKNITLAVFVIAALTNLNMGQTGVNDRTATRKVPTTNTVQPSTTKREILNREINLKYPKLRAKPCSILTRDEAEAIMSGSASNRAFVDPPRPVWDQPHAGQVRCVYGVRYEHPPVINGEDHGNSISISIDFENKYAKQGHLVLYPPKDYELIIVQGLGDEALYQHDKTPREFDYGTAVRPPLTDLDSLTNHDELFVRKGELVMTFGIGSIVVGNGDSSHVIEIARKALARIP
ncbi:MAG TPA: hypothetical protein VIV66_15200 [Pyrinomonadaceae bacterium]